MEDVTRLSATEIVRLTGSGRLSARETVEAFIRRIEAVNPALNALVFPLFERAQADAERLDRERPAEGEAPPLYGLPITVKEQFLVADSPTCFGLESRLGFRAAADGPLIARLRAAGALILGKTNVSQLLVYIESDNPAYGRTLNPWNPERTPGGSSGGEAAIIAAGGSPLGIGADLGGSIREPAHFCGIHGLKPTTGRLSDLDTRPGVLSMPAVFAIPPQTGPLARHVEDLDLAMRVLAAPGQRAIDATNPDLPWPDFRAVRLDGLKIALVSDDGLFRPSPAIRRAVKEAGEALRGSGARVAEWRFPQPEEIQRLYLGIFTSDGFAGIRRSLGRDRQSPQIRAMLSGGAIPGFLRGPASAGLARSGQLHLSRLALAVGRRGAEDFVRLLAGRQAYRERFLAALDSGGFDAIVCPPCALAAPPHGSTPGFPDFDGYARLFNLLGMPAGVVAASRVRPGEESDRAPGRDRVEKAAARAEAGSSGLPVGVQVAARHWREDIVLAVMAALESRFRTMPGYPAAPGAMAAAGR